MSVQNQNSPEVSVIMATYNSSETLRCAIASVLNQDFTNFELLVVGDHCTDDSEEVVNNFDDERIQWINLPQNVGSQSGPNNEGLKRARGYYIAYHGHDDIWLPHHLSTLLTSIKNNEVDLVYCLSVMVGPQGVQRTLGGPLAEGRTYEHSYHVPPSSWLHRKDLIHDVGYWPDPDAIPAGVDMHYLGQIAKAGKKISFVTALLILKFPSASWGLYSKKNDFPQIIYLQKVKKNWKSLEKDLLYDVAALQSKDYYPVYNPSESARNFITGVKLKILEAYSIDRWPVKQYRTYKFQKFRKKLNRARGLAEKK